MLTKAVCLGWLALRGLVKLNAARTTATSQPNILVAGMFFPPDKMQ